jgi:NarL family two-component system response regulator LiaR
MNPIRIIIVDDESVVREGVEAILSYQQDIQVVGKGADGITAVELARDTKPDVVLLDMVMPKMNGLQAIPLIKKESPASRILILSSFAESDQVYQSIKAGALGYLLKDSTREQLVDAIRDVSEGKASLHPAIAMKVIHEIDNPTELVYTADPLTPREMETLKLIARGLSNQEIAKVMVVHERTVAKYVSSILDKLQLANRTQVALYAIREGLAGDEPTKPRK